MVLCRLLLYLNYFKETNLENNIKSNFSQSTNTGESLIEDLKYLSTDKEGNEYKIEAKKGKIDKICLLYTSPSPRDS